MVGHLKLILSCVLMAGGMLMVLAGISLPTYAVQCDGEDLITDTECDPAHAVDKHAQVQAFMGCERDGSECNAAPNSECGTLHGWQVAQRGLCVTTVNPSDEGDCTEDAVTTVVEIRYFTSGCGWYTVFDCECILVENTTFQPQLIQICDCLESS